MNLKPIEQAKFDGIKNTVTALKSAALPHDAVIGAVAAQVNDFESTTRYVVKIHEEAQEGSWITLIDTKKDFLRARLSGDTGQALRTKIFGVPVDVKVTKIGEYEFTNAQISDALVELSKAVLKLDRPLSTSGNVDFNIVDGKAKLGAIESENSADDEQPESDEDNAVDLPVSEEPEAVYEIE